MIPYPKTFAPWEQPALPSCICKEHNAAETVEFCEVCNCYNDFCLACTPEPACQCVYVREDETDAADCPLHDPESHYNFLVRKAEQKAAAHRKPAGREVAEPFRTIIENFVKGAR